ncbi:MAG TPA: translocation/assembly module TamB domain-containing protein [Syntrophorhabdaceae bacterium]|jgi:translocation and assembly module TamB
MRVRILLILLLLAGIGGAALSWLLGTTAGARWLIITAGRAAGVKIEIARIEGRLWDRIDMGNTRIEWDTGDMAVGKMVLRWHPWLIASRRIVINELSASDIAIKDRSKEEPLRLEWPQPPSGLSWLQGWIGDFRIDRISYQVREEEPYRIDRVAASLTWRFGILEISGLKGKVPEGEIAGKVEGNFERPRLTASLSFLPVKSDSLLTGVALKAQLLRDNSNGMAGPMEARVTLSPARIFDIKGHFRALPARVDLSRLQIREEGRKGMVGAEGSVRLDAPYEGRAGVVFADLDLSREVKPLRALSGKLDIQGNLSAYQGKFDLSNKTDGPWKGALGGAFEGAGKEVTIDLTRGAFLEGRVTGRIEVKDEGTTIVSATLKTRDINPALVAKGWRGAINADISGEARVTEGRAPAITVKAILLKSMVREKPVQGIIDASLQENNLSIAHLRLYGDGFDVSAQGNLRERLEFKLALRDLGLFVPETGGSVNAEGWGRWKDGKGAGSVNAKGRNISARDLRLSSVKMDISMGTDGSMKAAAGLTGIAYKTLNLRSLSALLEGKQSAHFLKLRAQWQGGDLDAAFVGGYRKEQWTGEMKSLAARDTRHGGFNLVGPARLSLSRESISIEPIVLAGVKDEKLRLNAYVDMKKKEGFVDARWDRIDLGRAGPFLQGGDAVSGQVSGNLEARWRGGNVQSIAARLNGSGAFSSDGLLIGVPRVDTSLRWDLNGLASSIDVKLSPTGRIWGEASSGEGVRLDLPRSAGFSLSWESLDLQMARAFVPAPVNLKGSLNGTVKGRLLPERSIDVRAETRLENGSVAWKSGQGVMTAAIRTAKADATWRGNSLRGEMTLALADYGRLEGAFQLPLSARLPVTAEKDGPVSLLVSGSIREKGLITAFFPGFVRESHGRLDIKATAAGTWQRPGLKGNLILSGAGAYLPAAGVELKDVSARAEVTEDRVTLTSLEIHSGAGKMEGKGNVRLKSFKVEEFEGTITGKNFQAVYLPELRVQINPDLRMSGTSEQLIVRGTVTVPEASLYSQQTQVVKASHDVRVIDRPVPARKPFSFAVDGGVEIIMGDKVTIAAEGVNAALGGKVFLMGTSIDDIRAKGEIDIRKGNYRTYGVKLDIERGRIVFDGGPVEAGTLDILALRKVSETRAGEMRPTEIKAGVLVTGPLQSPVINLYSRPRMADTDVLSYMVLGTPLQGTSETALLIQAAEALLPKSQSTSLKDRLQSYLGIDTLGIETRPVQSTTTTQTIPTLGQTGQMQTGQTQTGSLQTSTTTQSLVTVGKYLTPRLYVSLGRSVLSNENLVTMRLTLSKRWELQSQTGTQSGVGLFYKIEFD